MAIKDMFPWCLAGGWNGAEGCPGHLVWWGQAFVGSWGTPVLCGPSHPLSKGQSPALSGSLCLQIREEIDHYGIRIYQFPECDSDEDEEFKLQDQALKVGHRMIEWVWVGRNL